MVCRGLEVPATSLMAGLPESARGQESSDPDLSSWPSRTTRRALGGLASLVGAMSDQARFELGEPANTVMTMRPRFVFDPPGSSSDCNPASFSQCTRQCAQLCGLSLPGVRSG